MKRTVLMGASLVVLVLIGAVTVMGGQMPMGSQGSEQEQSSGQSSMMGRGQMDPKAMARMLQLRGDRTSARILVKHSQISA
jgi:hypothetical protein